MQRPNVRDGRRASNVKRHASSFKRLAPSVRCHYRRKTNSGFPSLSRAIAILSLATHENEEILVVNATVEGLMSARRSSFTSFYFWWRYSTGPIVQMERFLGGSAARRKFDVAQHEGRGEIPESFFLVFGQKSADNLRMQ